MIEINPQFDPKTCTWFVEGMIPEAPTIAELLKQLGKAYKVPNYYPLGKAAPVIMRGAVAGYPVGKQKDKRWDKKQKAEPELPKEPKTPKPSVGKFFQDPDQANRVLDMWAAGEETVVISERCGVTTKKITSHILVKARELGDPRAIRRQNKRNSVKPADQKDVVSGDRLHDGDLSSGVLGLKAPAGDPIGIE